MSTIDRIEPLELLIDWLEGRIEFIEDYVYAQPGNMHRFRRFELLHGIRCRQLDEARRQLRQERFPDEQY
jgi:hypothetical protein